MSLSDRIASLAARIGIEVKTKIDASHPGLARAWVSFGYVNGQMVMHGQTRDVLNPRTLEFIYGLPVSVFDAPDDNGIVILPK